MRFSSEIEERLWEETGEFELPWFDPETMPLLPLPVEDLSWEREEEVAQELALQIAAQYEAAMSRHGSWVNQFLAGHILSGCGLLFTDEATQCSLVGQFLADTDVFAISHFAPATLRSGAECLEQLGADPVHPVVCAIPQAKAEMLERLGWSLRGEIPQYFAGEIVMKRVCLNKAATRFVKAHPELLSEYL